MNIILLGADVIDGIAGEPFKRHSIAIEGNSISAFSKQSAARHQDAETIDLSGMTVLPGLIDAHAHLAMVYDFSAEADNGLFSAAEIAAWTFENCGLCLDAGFTTVRDMCGADGGLTRAIDSGAVRGPRVYPSAAAIVQTGGHGNLAGPFCHHNYSLDIPGLVQMIALCDGPDAVRKQARTNFRRGATQLKVFISGGVVSTTDRLEDTQLTIEELAAAVHEARARDTYVAGHAHNVRAIRNGLAAGLECFEHGTMLDEATAQAIAKAGAALDPTLAVCHLMSRDWRQMGLTETIAARVAGCEASMTDAVRIAESARVLMGSGSDLLGRRQNRRGLELTLKARILSPMRAIQCATANNAKIMRLDGRLGSIAPGKLADIIAINGDPLSEPELFDDPARVVLVIKDGVIVKNLLAGRQAASTGRDRESALAGKVVRSD
ncbi:MAG: amidohydrolase family protein [Candidatus Eremiobacteraeota bacterium]|nr:amidohydrolase family protein [Candidatus Eremiobacteraeota bacterium]